MGIIWRKFMLVLYVKTVEWKENQNSKSGNEIEGGVVWTRHLCWQVSSEAIRLNFSNFCACYTFRMDRSQSSSDGIVISYVLPVLWMTSFYTVLLRCVIIPNQRACKSRNSNYSSIPSSNWSLLNDKDQLLSIHFE